MQEVARHMLSRLPAMEASDKSFEERLIALCVVTRQALLRHASAAPLILRFFPRHILIGAYERLAEEQPYGVEIGMTVIEAVEKYTYGASLFEAAAQASGTPSMPPVAGERFPALARAVAESRFHEEDMFVETLRMILTGARTRIPASGALKPDSHSQDPAVVPPA